MPRVVVFPDDDSVVGCGCGCWRLLSLLAVVFEVVVAEAEMLRRLLIPAMLRLDAALRSLGMKMMSREAIVRRRFLGCVSFLFLGGGWFSLSSVIVGSWYCCCCCCCCSSASISSSSSFAAARLVPRDDALAGEWIADAERVGAAGVSVVASAAAPVPDADADCDASGHCVVPGAATLPDDVVD